MGCREGSILCCNSDMPEFDDPVTRHLMSTRWRYCSWAAYVVEDDLKWWFRDFVRAYRAHAAGVGLDRLPDLQGLKRLAGQIGNNYRNDRKGLSKI